MSKDRFVHSQLISITVCYFWEQKENGCSICLNTPEGAGARAEWRDAASMSKTGFVLRQSISITLVIDGHNRRVTHMV